MLDGDTIVVDGEHVGLLAIDGQVCQPAGQEWPCGDASGAALSKLTAGKEVICRVPAYDRYRRLPGTCSVGGPESQRRDGATWLLPALDSARWRAASGTTIPRQSRPARRAAAGGAGNSSSPWV